MLRFFPVLGGAIALFACACIPALELVPCDLTAGKGRLEVDAQCGMLAVPLDPDDPSGVSIELFVAVVEALAEDPAPDPLTVIAGGPGDAATRFFAMAQNAFARILRYRDIVLVDQRGSGQSVPLRCANLDAMGILDDASVDADTLVELALDCLANLAFDPRFFTTSVAVQDLERIRAALGYPQLNLYGISYGTRVAQHYLRRFPNRTRSVVLDGVVPATASLGPDIALDSQAALDALFARCRNDAACQAAFPNLRVRFQSVRDRLQKEPVEIAFGHPRTGEPVTTTINHFVLAAVVRLLVYSPPSSGLLPVLVEAAYEGDYEALAAQAHILSENLEGLAAGLNYAILCTEDQPFWGELDLDAQRRTYLGSTFVEVLGRVCEAWPRGVLDADFKQPVASDAPVLLLSGELDPITPPRYASLVAAHFANAVNIVGRGQGHGMLTLGCVQRLMASFVESAAPQSLDLACVERIRPFPLFVSPMGPAP